MTHLFARAFLIPAVAMLMGAAKAADLATTNGAPVPSGLVAWWPFEGSGVDVSGRGHNMDLVGTPAFGAGEVSQAVAIDGVNDDGRVAANGDLDLGANQGLTMEMWINPASTAVQQPLLEWTDNNTIVGLHFWISVASAGGGNGSLFVNVTDRNGVAHHVSSSPGVVLANRFTHVAMTYSKASGLAKLYANGQVVASQNIGQITPETRYALYAGWRPIGGEWRYTGKLDEISLYNRELSLQELAAIAQAGPAGKSGATDQGPRITSQPASVTTRPGSNAIFSVVAVGTPPLAYQWLFNGTLITGETNISLILDPTKPKQEGTYSVLVRNPFGTTTSSNATLTVSRSRRSSLLSSGAKVAGHHEFVLDGEVGVRYLIEASEDLQNWSQIDEVTGTGNPVLIRDTDTSKFSKRFYRAVPLTQ